MAHLNPDLEGKVALITGASSGIGRYTAVEMAKWGCKVSLTGRKKDALEETIKMCQVAGLDSNDIFSTVADLESAEDCKRIVEETVQNFGRLDILVNSGGQLISGGIKDIPLEDFERQMKVNVTSVLIITQTAVPHLQKTKGSIVNISSLGGLKPIPGKLAYCVSKASIDMMTKTLALELAGDGIRVNAVNPGTIATELHKRMGMDEETYKKYLIRSNNTHPIGRYGQPDEVGRAIVFLASHKLSGFITGVLLPMDGGRYCA